jgi:hypothetical protein
MARPFVPVLTALPFTLLLAMSLWSHSPAWPQTAATAPLPAGAVIDYHSEDHTLTVHVSALPLRQLLDVITTKTNIRFRPPAPMQEFDNRPVTRTFDRMPIERAIKQLLGPSNTAMIYAARPAAAGRAENILLREVRIIDLGVIPIVATAPGDTGAGARQNPALFDGNQVRRDSKKQKIAERKQSGSDNRKGNRGGSGSTSTDQTQSKTPTDQSSSGSSAPNSNNKSK